MEVGGGVGLAGLAGLAEARAGAEEHIVRVEDVARHSPFVRRHITMLGRYSFPLRALPGGLRPLRDPGTLTRNDRVDIAASC